MHRVKKATDKPQGCTRKFVVVVAIGLLIMLASRQIVAGTGSAEMLPRFANDVVFMDAPPNLPSVLVKSDSTNKDMVGIYGGKGDKPHLGGFTSLDTMGISPKLWSHMMQNWTIKSVVDVGCGKGVSTSYFKAHGARVLCVEGSHDAVTQSLLPPDNVVEHDFSRGPWWPTDTYDALWSVEFLEHVGTQYMQNYLPVFRKAALILVSHSIWGGYHHVEVHDDNWWIRKMTTFGFTYMPELTKEARHKASDGMFDGATADKATRYKMRNNGQHIRTHLLVFVNPTVSALPQHSHLFYNHGCYGRGVVPCEGADLVPTSHLPLAHDPALSHSQSKAWLQALEASLEKPTDKENAALFLPVSQAY